MKNTYVKAAAAVPSVTIGLPAANAAETIKLMQAHADCGVIVFPGGSSTAGSRGGQCETAGADSGCRSAAAV